MATSMKKVLLALGTAGLLGGCATGYYDDGYYGDRYGYDRYAYGPTYYDYYPGYVGPSIGFGATYIDRDDHRRWRDRDGRRWHDDGRHLRGPDGRGYGNTGIDFTDSRQNSGG